MRLTETQCTTKHAFHNNVPCARDGLHVENRCLISRITFLIWSLADAHCRTV